MKYICLNWKQCERALCYHSQRHNERAECSTVNCHIGKCHCIPVHEVRYEIESGGYCLTPCLNAASTKVNSVSCQRCPHFQGIDKDRQIVFCSHPEKEKDMPEDKPKFKVGDRVKIIHTDFRGKDYQIGCIQRIVEVGYNSVEIGNERLTFSFDEIELIKEAPMPKYEKIKPCTMFEMQKEDPCYEDFKNACRNWADQGYALTDDISLDDLIYQAEIYHGIPFLLDRKFIKEVKEEVFYKVGNRFRGVLGDYILAISDEYENVLLINLETGWKWSKSKKVNNTDKIPKSEFDKIYPGFTKVEK